MLFLPYFKLLDTNLEKTIFATLISTADDTILL
jgi:hypothetical protein